jgi:hypothetical protein
LPQRAEVGCNLASGARTGCRRRAFHDQAKRLAALRNRIPNIVLFGLFGFAAIACGFAGYASGLDTKRTQFPVYIMGLLVATVVLLIFDPDRPSSGFVVNNQQSMIDTAASMAAFPD